MPSRVFPGEQAENVGPCVRLNHAQHGASLCQHGRRPAEPRLRDVEQRNGAGGYRLMMPPIAPGAQEVKSRAGRHRSRPPPGGEQEEEQHADEPGSRARSRSKLSPGAERSGELIMACLPGRKNGPSQPQQQQQQPSRRRRTVELGQADFSTDSPPRGAARWRHGGDKSQHVPRGPDPDVTVTRSSPGVARPGEGRLQSDR